MSQNQYEIIEEKPFLDQKEYYCQNYSSLSSDVDRYKKILLVRPDDGRLRKAIDNANKIYLYKSDMHCKSLCKGQRDGFQIWFARNITQSKIHLLLLYIKSEESKDDQKELEKALQLYNNLIDSQN